MRFYLCCSDPSSRSQLALLRSHRSNAILRFYDLLAADRSSLLSINSSITAFVDGKLDGFGATHAFSALQSVYDVVLGYYTMA